MVNRTRLFWAGFTAILAAGVGFIIRSGLLDIWAKDYGFNGEQLGAINGAGFSGFCFGIIIGGVVADKIGYGKLVIAAFLLHAGSALMTFTVTKGTTPLSAYTTLYWASFVFAVANGTLEAVANPLVATLFPENRAHYLNMLHASWPLGMILGGLSNIFLGKAGVVLVEPLAWQMQLALFLIPTVIYGFMFFGQAFPKSEASEKGLSIGEMFKDVGILGGLVICFLLALFFKGALGLNPYVSFGIAGVLLIAIGVITKFSTGAVLLFVLFIAHLLVGSVELGTEGWIQNITGILLTPTQGNILLVYTSLIMFGLRFTAHSIEKNLKLSPVGILLCASVIACIGLTLATGISTFSSALVALGVFAVGKTFFWPTMLAVASDRFPRTGAVAISIMGGIGMLSAGLIGGPGLGYFKDSYAAGSLKASNAALYETTKNPTPSSFLFFDSVNGLDPKKVDESNSKLPALATNEKGEAVDKYAAIEKLPADDKSIVKANIDGARGMFKVDTFIPGAMAVIYLLLLLYFKSIGGYKAVHIGKPDTDATQ